MTPDTKSTKPDKLSTGLSISVKMSTHALNARKINCGIGFQGVVNNPVSLLLMNKLDATVSDDIS